VAWKQSAVRSRAVPCLRESEAFLFNNTNSEGGTANVTHRRRYSKRELLGSLHVDYVMPRSDLGLVPGTNGWEVLRAFLDRGEGRAERLVEARAGFLILQSISSRPNTGAIYVYRENLGAFFWLTFGEREDDLSGEDIQKALRTYRLMAR